ncbi:hypothetical protein F5Y16DRAFT_401921 [Xylariaceae sp. FL0255]|nr:hypothetical protein F5Y16DRAFT_401921 [Xylariaceae sp. FL0255]
MGVLPLLTLEEHFLAQAAKNTLVSVILKRVTRSPHFERMFQNFPGIQKRIYDTSTLRLASMDENKVSLQVLSHVPGVISPAEARATNDEAAAAVKANPSRLAALAALPVADPAACADELRRCVQDLGFAGALIGNHANGTYYEGAEYDTLWRTAEELDVPIYLHPTIPSPEQARVVYYPGREGSENALSARAAAGIGEYAWGWHSDVAVHVLRLFGAGLFDRFPRLKIVIGHFGEMLPFMVQRVEWATGHWPKRERNFTQAYNENIWITTSGVWSLDPMATILRNTSIDKILYSVDYPFTSNEDGLKWMKDLVQSGLVTRDQLEKIAYKNAEELLKVKATKAFEF